MRAVPQWQVVIVEDPFGDDLDDLNPDGLMVKTEQQIQSFLMSEIPEGITTKAEGFVTDDLPIPDHTTRCVFLSQTFAKCFPVLMVH